MICQLSLPVRNKPSLDRIISNLIEGLRSLAAMNLTALVGRAVPCPPRRCETARSGLRALPSGSYQLVLPLLVATLMLAPAAWSHAANPSDTPREQERELINLLNSNAAPADKALACKKLTIYGTADAVPALAKLLADEQLASWARIPLEAIPGSAPDAALRKAMGQLHGRLLVGVINSIAVRRDSGAVNGLIKHLADNDDEVGSAAAIALGRIGGVKAGKALRRALADAPEKVRPAVAQGCLRCAEWYAGHGRPAEAIKNYELVRTATLPKHIVVEATRLTILAQKSVPLLLEQLRSPDKAFFRVGLLVARELSGSEVTSALVKEMQQAAGERQALLLMAVADRPDRAAELAVIEVAKSGTTKLRVTAIGALEREGKVESIPVLLDAATATDPTVAQAGRDALTRLPGDEASAALLAQLPAATGKAREVLIDVAGRRSLHAALPTAMGALQDSDAGIRAAAIRTVGTLGGEAQIADLVRLIQRSENSGERGDLQTALIAISTRTGASSVPALLPLAKDSNSGLRLLGLPVLAAAGGPDALAAIQTAVQDQDEAVRDEAVRTLSTWPNNWPDDTTVLAPLLALAKDGGKTSYQVLALRGYLHCLEGDKQLNNSEKLVQIKTVLPLIQRPEEQQLVFGIVRSIPNSDALDLLVDFANRPATAEEACHALMKLGADKKNTFSKEQRLKALQAVADKSKDDHERTRAERLLKNL